MTNTYRFPPPVQLPQYIGRTSEKELLVAQTQVIEQNPFVGSRAIYIEARGGMGKTRLLQEYPLLVGEYVPDLYVTDVVDFYDIVSRNAEFIETSLIHGLRRLLDNKDNKPHDVSEDEAKAVFQPYWEYHAKYTQARMSGSASTYAEYPAEILRDTFIACWNKLSERYPVTMRFDTLETLFQTTAPPEALIRSGEELPDTNPVLNWFERVLPELRRTLILLSGRPLDLDQYPQNPVIERLRKLINTDEEALLWEPVQILKPLQSDEDIRAYLEAYDVYEKALQHRSSLQTIRALTGGHPLLLACYAESLPDTEFPAPKPHIQDRDGFEVHIANEILHPSGLDMEGTHRSLSVVTLLRSFYILSIARSGLTKQELADLLKDTYNVVPDMTVIESLHQSTFIKTLLTRRNTASREQEVEVFDNGSELLFLHDEIQAIIDDNGIVSFEGVRDEVLDSLIEQAKERVSRIQRSPVSWSAIPLVRAMSDHIYYALMRDPILGYRTYAIYSDQLLRQRDINGALILSNTVWSTLSMQARKSDSIQTYLKPWEEQGLSYEEVVADEQVRYIKRLVAEDKNPDAVEQAENLRRKLHAQLEHDEYLNVDLTLIEEQARIKAKPFGPETSFEYIIRLLDNDQPLQDAFLQKQRRYFLGVAYTLRSFLRYQEQRYVEALSYDNLARKSFEAYRPVADELNANYAELIAQANVNYAYNLLMSGHFQQARLVSEKTIKDHAQFCRPYRQALVYNTDGLIRRARGELLMAQQSIRKAQEAAEVSENARVRGMVRVALAQLQREIDNRQQGFPREEIDTLFDEAIDLLANEPDQQREAYFQRSGFRRDCAIVQLKAGDTAEAERYKKLVLQWLDAAITLLPEQQLTMQHAEFLKSKAIIHVLMGEYTQASPLLNQAERILCEIKAPDYVHVICGKVAFQRGLIQLHYYEQQHQALLLFTIGLARQYLYADQHRDLANFQDQIEGHLIHFVDDAVLKAFLEELKAGLRTVVIGEGELAYQPPADLDRWEYAFTRSVNFMTDTIQNYLLV
jgi:hypothetical protein